MKSRILHIVRSDSVCSMAASGFVSLGRFAAAVVMARLCDTETFAQFVVLMMTLAVILNIPNAWLVSPMINQAGRLKQSERSVFFAWSRRRLLKCAIFTVGGLSLLIPFRGIAGFDFWTCIGYLLTIFVGALGLFPRACAQVAFRTRWVLFGELCGLLLTPVFAFFIWHLLDSPLAAFWLGYAGGQLVALGLIIRGGFSSHSSEDGPDQELVQQTKSEGRHMLKGTLASSAGSRLQSLVLGIVSSAGAVAAFGTANALAGPLRMLSAGLATVMRPRLSGYAGREDFKGFYRYLFLLCGLVSLVGASGVVVALFGGEWIIGFVFGENMRSAGRILPLALLWTGLDAFTSVLMISLQILRSDGAAIAAKVRLEAAFLSILLMAPACLWAGAAGAFVGLILAEVWYVCRVLPCLSVGKALKEFLRK